MNVQRLMTKIGRKLKKSSPTILTAFGAGGVVATTVLAVKATPKAVDMIHEKQIRHPDPMTKTEKIQLVWQCYIPTALVGGTTIACIFGANILNKKQQASMASIYAMLDQSYKRYVQAAKEVYGEDADERIRAQVAKDMYIGCDGGYLYSPDEDTASEKVLFYDYQSSRYFESTVAGVINAQYHLNRDWSMRGEVSINTFYEFLGIDKIKGWDDLGWSWDFAEQGFTWIDFGMKKTVMDDGLECYVIYAIQPPEPFETVF